MASYDMWKSTDAIGDRLATEEREQQCAEEAAREHRWMTFVGVIRERMATRQCLSTTLEDLCNARFWYESGDESAAPVFEQRCIDFAESEGWSGLVSAFARALREKDAEVAEIERRR